ncbi:MAG: hypothetical protein IJX50_03685 [Clostridia bacterium]|nr:hypothetical protein [Clostridia bacterium]
MNDKLKDFLILTAYRAVAAAVILIVIAAINFLTPDITQSISSVWTQNTDFKKVIVLLTDTARELIPF